MRKIRKLCFPLLLIILLIFGFEMETYGVNLPQRVVGYKSRGQAVRDIQTALKQLGYELSVDGIYGPATRKAVLDFQRKEARLAKDGVYGLATRRAIISRLDPEEDIEEEKKVVEEEEVEVKKSEEKIAYLTFDDGPSTTVTPDILATLREYNIKATFFILGSMAEKNPDLIKTIKEEGHAIGNHSYSHKYKQVYASKDNFFGEINLTNKILKNILGEEYETRLVRFPGGSFEDYKKKYKTMLEENNYLVYDWNALNGDAEGKKLSANRLVERLKETTRGQKELVVLMHDTYGKESTAQALPAIIDYLIGQGYKFDVLEE